MAVRERYSHVKADKHKEKKRKEAEERAIVRAGITDETQLLRLDAGNHAATKERARLRHRIAVRKRVIKGIK